MTPKHMLSLPISRRSSLWRRSAVIALALLSASCTVKQDAGPTQQNEAASSSVGPAPAGPAPLGAAGPRAPEVANQTPVPPPAETRLVPGTGVFVKPSSSSPASSGDQNQGGDITLNFVNADVREVLPRVLGDILHLNYTIDPKVQANITIQTSRPLRQPDVLPVLQETLRASGLALLEANGVYRVMNIDEAVHTGTAPVTVGGRAGPAPSYNVQILPLKYVSAADLQRTLQPFVPKDAVLQIDPTRNVVILSGSNVDLSTITDMIKAFDVDWIAGMSFGIVGLQTADPKEVADQLATIFGPKGSVPLPGMLSFAPLERMNAVLVVSPQRAYVEQARTWIERLDRGEADNRPKIFEYHVQNSRARDVAQVLTQLFSNGQVRTVQPQTAPGTKAATIGGSGSGGSSGFNSLGTPGGSSAPPGLGTGLSSSQSNGMLGATPGASSGAMPNGLSLAGPETTAQQPDDRSGATSDIDQGGAGSAPGQLQLPPIRVVADEKNNTLVIYARPRDYQMVEQALKRIDVVPLEVLIEATIAEVTLGNDLQYGLQYFFHQHENQFIFGGSQTPITAAASTIAGTFPGFNYILGSANANIVLNLLSSITNVHVISSPQLLVLDHQSASLLVGAAIPIPTAQIQSTITTGAPIVNTVQYVDTGVILKVTPLVNANGQVTLDVGQEVSEVATTTAQTSSTSTFGPTITERRLQSSVTVQDGETVALGGLIQDTNSNTKNGIPLLSDIPVIGAAFGTTDKNVQRTELLILLSPKIIHNAADARAATEELRSRLHTLQIRAP
ncbi:MAG TPA: type II secretion system secretin GspD [Stellaceae bacterium]|jgi:general secretion pathway protein D|nr:type II secretion system secretin GspD [Stellaceae bacterium]